MHIGIDPAAFHIGALEVRWYGIFLALAVVWLIFWVWLQIRKKHTSISVDTLMTMALVAIPSGIVFARLLHVFDNIIVAKLHPELAATGAVIDYTLNPGSIIGGQGLTAYGAILGASLGVWIYCKVAKVKAGEFFDMMAPAVFMAQAIGRIGCLLNGCCYGVKTSLPFGIEYTNPASSGWGAGFTQPTVIYEIIFCVIMFFVMLKLRGKLRPAGSLFLLYLSLYSIWRISTDFLRDGNPFLFGLHQAQVVSIIVLTISLVWMIPHTRWVKKEPVSILLPEPPPSEPPKPKE
ncbi:MAG: prolipoprotein diacylglyceryl transferase [Dehalococcoidales bacterium]|nr:prolipoprotein diacylglyceryl transferase [Dehalococcoidales bacterium]